MFQTLFCVLAVAVTSPTTTPEKGSDTIQINFEDPGAQDNRAPVYQIVEGYVDPSAGLAILYFTVPCGIVHFQLENLNDSSCVNGTIAGTGLAVIPFSCSAGHWKLILTLSGGDEYVGEFNI